MPVVEYTDKLVGATTARNLDRLIDTTRDGETADYSWYTGWWCPRHEHVGNADDVANQFALLCRSKGGRYDGVQLCRDIGNPNNVLFVARVTATPECSNGPTATIQVYEPIKGMEGRDYVAKLYELGYQSTEDQERKALERERAREAQESARLQREEQLRIETAANVAKLLESSEGTRICKNGVIDYVLEPGIRREKRKDGVLIGQLEGLSTDQSRLKFRVVGHFIPNQEDYETQYSHSYKMGEYIVQPGIVYWDVVDHWKVCDIN